jgi:iron complex outermembrane receptor protein
LLSQESLIKGKVVDLETGQPIPNANVVVVGTLIGSSSDNNGEFEIKVKPGIYEVEVKVIGYEVERKRVVLEKGKISYVEFRLKQSYV